MRFDSAPEFTAKKNSGITIAGFGPAMHSAVRAELVLLAGLEGWRRAEQPAALAGYDLTYADHIRRNLDREDLLPGFRADFLRRAIARGVNARLIILR